MDDDISAVCVTLEQGPLDPVVDRVDLFDVEIAGNCEVQVDVSSRARSPVPAPR